MTKQALQKQQERVASYFKQEMDLLREVLANLLEERDALLSNQAEVLKKLSKNKDHLLESLLKIREGSQEAMRRLRESLGSEEASSLEDLVELYPYEDFSDLVFLQKTLKSLIEKIQGESERNSYLLQNKVSITRQVIHRLQGNGSPKSETYGPAGYVRGAPKKTKVTLINREV